MAMHKSLRFTRLGMPYRLSVEVAKEIDEADGSEALAVAEEAKTEAEQAKRNAGTTPIDFGAAGDGSVNDAPAVREWAQAEPSPHQYLMAQGVTGLEPRRNINFRGDTLTKNVPIALNMIGGGGLDGATFRDGVVDMNRRNLGDVTGHGMSISGHDITVRDMEFRDFGSDGVGGGAGINVSTPSGDTHSRRFRLLDSKFSADPIAPLAFGYVLSNIECGIISRIYVENVVGGNAYAHELKNDAIYNSMAQLVAKDSSVAVAFGQQTEGIDGSDYNVVTNFIGAQCDQGILVGEGVGNVFVGGVHDAQGSPGNSSIRGVQLVGPSSENHVSGVSLFGEYQRSVSIEGDRNTVDVAAYGTATVMAFMSAGSKGNVIRFAHTGDRTSIIPYITDNSGSGITGADGNVYRSDSTGERIGSRSGYFHDRLGASGAAFQAAQKWRHEDSAAILLAGATPGDNGMLFGLVHNVPGSTRNGQLSHIIATAGNYWLFRTGETDALRVHSEYIRPAAAGYGLGQVNNKFATAYVNEIRPGPTGLGNVVWTSGAGDPEGNVTGAVGSIYTRTDGGAGTTLYVKEIGTGNTGWVAK